MKKTLSMALAALFLAASPSAALAQSSVDGYRDKGAVLNQIEGNDGGSGTAPQADTRDSADSPASQSDGSPSATTTADAGKLPFTGLDLALLAGAGAVLLGMGLGMRHLTRSPESV